MKARTLFRSQLLLIIFLCSVGLSYSQQTIILHIPKALEADAGVNVTINQNEQVILGGSPTAQFGLPPYQYNWTPTTDLNNPSSANPVATPSDSIIYTLIVTDANGCSQTSDVTINIITIGINEISPENDITIFPNPNHGNLSIDFHSLEGIINLSFMDMNGKLIKEERIILEGASIKTFDLNNFLSGNYLLSVSGDGFIINRSIIVK